MLAGWDKAQDLRQGEQKAPERPKPDITKAVADAADRITAARVVSQMVREGKRMSLLGKMQHLTETAQDFHRETEAALDGIAAKIEAAKKKREEAEATHHGYYDAIMAGVDESIKAIDRLSNGPLPEGGQ